MVKHYKLSFSLAVEIDTIKLDEIYIFVVFLLIFSLWEVFYMKSLVINFLLDCLTIVVNY